MCQYFGTQLASAGADVAGVGPEAGMGYVTGVPLACGLELLLQGKLTQRGVFAPEAAGDAESSAINPHDFFTTFAAKSDQPNEQNTDTEMPIVTWSWDSDPKSIYTAAINQINETAG